MQTGIFIKLSESTKTITIVMLLLTGTIVAQTETKIPKDSLPASIKKHLSSNFHDYSVSNTTKVNNNGTITYKLEVRKEKSDVDGVVKATIFFLIYGTEGRIVSKRKEKEEYYTDSPKNKTKHENHDHNHNAPMPNY